MSNKEDIQNNELDLTKPIQFFDGSKKEVSDNSIISSLFEADDNNDADEEGLEGTKPLKVEKKTEEIKDETKVEELELEEVSVEEDEEVLNKTDNTTDDEDQQIEDKDETESTKEENKQTETEEGELIEVKKGQEQSPEILEAQADLRQIARDITRLQRVYSQRPEAPKADASDEAIERYNRRLEAWEDKCADAKSEIEALQEQSRQSALVIQNKFLATHKEFTRTPALLQEFNTFLSATPLGQSIYYGVRTGEMNVEEAYEFWAHKSGKKIAPRGNSATPAKKAVKITKPAPAGSGTASSNQTNKTAIKGKAGYPKEFAYLNKPELQEFVSTHLKAVSPITGRKRTLKEVNEYAKAQWKVLNKKDLW